MVDEAGEAGAQASFTLEQEVVVSGDQGAAVPEPERRRRNRKRLGVIMVNGRKISAWYEGGMIKFRQKRRHRVENISLYDVYHRAVGQLELALA